jgi:hypothetical protein
MSEFADDQLTVPPALLAGADEVNWRERPQPGNLT